MATIVFNGRLSQSSGSSADLKKGLSLPDRNASMKSTTVLFETGSVMLSSILKAFNFHISALFIHPSAALLTGTSRIWTSPECELALDHLWRSGSVRNRAAHPDRRHRTIPRRIHLDGSCPASPAIRNSLNIVSIGVNVSANRCTDSATCSGWHSHSTGLIGLARSQVPMRATLTTSKKYRHY